MKSSFGLAIALLATVSGLALPAFGQDVNADRLRFAVDRDGILTVQSGHVPKHLTYDFALTLDYALAPLVAYEQERFIDERQGEIVSSRASARVHMNIALFEWFSVGAEIPYVVSQTGELEVFGVGTNPVVGGGLSDISLVPKVRLLRQRDAGVDLALVLATELPTSQEKGGYLGAKGTTFRPELAISGVNDEVTLAFNLGARLTESERLVSTDVGSAILARAAVEYRLDDEGLPLGMQFAFDTEASVDPTPLDAGLYGAEAIFGFDYVFEDRLVLFAGGSIGLIGGPRVPEFRAFTGLRYAPRRNDKDEDGILDVDDLCRKEAEDRDGFQDSDGCPDVDNDDDGVLDVDDGCPMQAEDRDGFRDGDGCVDPDNDGDEIFDAADACPDQAEDLDGFEDEDGCPEADNDQDKIPDHDDACPNRAGERSLSGCPFIDKDGDRVWDGCVGCRVEGVDVDQCLDEPEDRDGFEDEDGCPEPDNDADGIPDDLDRCPDASEDRDAFEDEDGCPDLDNDDDGVPDIDDACPNKKGRPDSKRGAGCR